MSNRSNHEYLFLYIPLCAAKGVFSGFHVGLSGGYYLLLAAFLAIAGVKEGLYTVAMSTEI